MKGASGAATVNSLVLGEKCESAMAAHAGPEAQDHAASAVDAGVQSMVGKEVDPEFRAVLKMKSAPSSREMGVGQHFVCCQGEVLAREERCRLPSLLVGA